MPEAKTIPAKYIFLDIVGFTHNRSAEAQSHIVDVLNHIVETSIFEHGIPKERVLFLPASDDICVALLNIESPYDIHLLVALSIIREVHKYSAATENEMRKFQVRVGLNSNTDNLITDINGHQNIAGAGVNMASRLMKLADENQILVSAPVFEALRYHEKYLSSFKAFRANIRHGLELPVYQFTAKGHPGLNTSVPSSLEGSEKIAPQPVKQTPGSTTTAAAITARSLGSVEFVKKPKDTQLSDPWAPQPAAAVEAEQTQSYLKGILPEPERAETKTGWIKSKAVKTEPLPFLEQAESSSQSRPLVWGALILLLAGASFGTWFWMQRAGEQAPNTDNTPSSNTISLAPNETAAPTNTSATAALPSNTSNQAAADKNAAPIKPSPAFTSKPAAAAETAPETRAKNTVETERANPPVQRLVAAPRRPATVQRTVEQRPQPKPQAKQQSVKAQKPKTSKRITIDDLINDK